MNRWIRPTQLRHLIEAHALELVREPGVLFWGIVFPILMSLGLGLAFTKKGNSVHEVAVIQPKPNTASADTSLISRYLNQHHAKEVKTATGYSAQTLTLKDDQLGDTRFVFLNIPWAAAMIQLKRGNISIVLEEKRGSLEYHFDPMNPDAQLLYIKLSGLFNGTIPIDRTSNTEIKPLTVKGTRYIDFLVPGLIAMGIMMSCMWGISYGTIDNRSKKLLRRMVATPMKKSHYLIALITVRIAMNFVESGLLFLVVWLVFGITIQGSLPALFIIFLSGNIAFAGIAILLSSRTAKTEVGNGLINAVVTPMMVLSGIFFSYHNFPEWSIAIIQKLPLTMIADGMRSVFIEGADIQTIAGTSIILIFIGVLTFASGMKLFRWH